MKLEEYLEVKHFTYLEYCDYLQSKYGLSEYDYMTKNFHSNKKARRTSEGLITHHKYEDTAIMLSTREYAINYPFEWQKKENLVYCDYLEHLLLHILICEYPSKDKYPHMNVGVGGVVNFIAPELNDLYSGWETKQSWRKNCHDLVRDDKWVYLTLMKRFKENNKEYINKKPICLYKSYNANYGLWVSNYNKEIYYEISLL